MSILLVKNFPCTCIDDNSLAYDYHLKGYFSHHQHTAAAECLQDIGGIEFLTNLRKDVSSALQPVIDQILENIMRLPDVQLDQHAPECIYQKHNHTGTCITKMGFEK